MHPEAWELLNRLDYRPCYLVMRDTTVFLLKWFALIDDKLALPLDRCPFLVLNARYHILDAASLSVPLCRPGGTAATGCTTCKKLTQILDVFAI